MTTLPANSTFLPVLDDLLSPDFRTVSIPGQTPQTPAETPVSATGAKVHSFAENHTGQLTTKVGFTAGRESQQDPLAQHVQMNGSLYAHGTSSVGKKHHLHATHHSHSHRHNAASRIQKWWKSSKARVRVEENGGVDLKAERAKHAIRHHRTEDHVRFLETEVNRLKSALVAERKLRSLQLEAIRSLWSQVQKVSTMSSTPPTSGRGGENGNIMSQSMPNGLPVVENLKENGTSSAGCMSMSLHGALERGPNSLGTVKEVSESSPALCECTKEIKNLRESFTGEMAQLRNMIDQLKLGNNQSSIKPTEGEPESTDDSDSRIFQMKRPLTLNLVGISSKDKENVSSSKAEDATNDNVEGSDEKKKEIAGYANQMASSILEGAVEKEEPDNVKE